MFYLMHFLIFKFYGKKGADPPLVCGDVCNKYFLFDAPPCRTVPNPGSSPDLGN